MIIPPAPLVYTPSPQPLMGQRVSYHTLGCKLNFAETSTLGRELAALGALPVEEGEPADICIINTCTVTGMAERKGRSLIRSVAKHNPQALIVVTGCYAQLASEELLALDGVDLVVGAGRKSEICDLIVARLGENKPGLKQCFVADHEHMHRFEGGCSSDDRTRHFLKVQDGCNYRCTYCTIPKARGFSRNGSVADLVAQAQRVAAGGGLEIVLTGVNIGDFGRTTGEKLLQLLEGLSRVEGIARYRISSLEPDLLSDEIIDFVATHSTFMPHFHLPLQSGSDAVLQLMGRRYDTALFADRVARIKSVLPDAFIGIDVIVGMRGETEQYFEETVGFLQQIDFTRLHVFSYSERPGTRALAIPHVVSPAEKHERSVRLHQLSADKLAAFYAGEQGHLRPILWEKSEQQGKMLGYSDNYIRVTAPYEAALAGSISYAYIGAQLSGEEICEAHHKS